LGIIVIIVTPAIKPWLNNSAIRQSSLLFQWDRGKNLPIGLGDQITVKPEAD